MDWESLTADCVDFVRRLVRTPGMSGDEGAVAGLVAEEMRCLGFDEVWIDDLGNVSGRVAGREPALGAVVLCSHTDVVDPGDPALWSVPPYAGRVVDGRIVGRGACDIKGPLAVHVYSLSALLRAGERPRRDTVVCALVEEEMGGAGAVHWARQVDFPVDLVLLGEPSDNRLALGHRGIRQMWVTFRGRSAHASAPERAANPNLALADLLVRLRDAAGQLPSHPVLGPTTIVPTILEVDTTSPNVTPAWTRVLLDVRTATESVNSLKALVSRLIGDWPHDFGDPWSPDPHAPLPDSDETILGFYTPPDDPAVERVRAAIARGTGQLPELTCYRFATDGRHLVGLGAPILGYSPAEEEQAHVADESISIAKMEASLRGHVQLLRDF